MVAGGFGVCNVPESVQALQLPRLVYRPLATKADSRAAIELYCAYRPGDASPLLKGLLDVVRAYRHERELTPADVAG